eukprot:6945821-Heterocapsa_arctica.AAC.1
MEERVLEGAGGAPGVVSPEALEPGVRAAEPGRAHISPRGKKGECDSPMCLGRVLAGGGSQVAQPVAHHM